MDCPGCGTASMTAFRFPPLADKMSADLYFHGLAAVDATLPSAGIVMPSTAMPCVNCHGDDGQGGREGGVAVSLALADLTRPWARAAWVNATEARGEPP